MYRFYIKLKWSSRQGMALALKTFDFYRNSPLFEERMKHFGSVGAAKMFSWDEFWFCKNMVLRDKKLKFTILFFPGRIIRECSEKDEYIRGYIDLWAPVV